jgi:hypothetical protein
MRVIERLSGEGIPATGDSNLTYISAITAFMLNYYLITPKVANASSEIL